VQIPRSSAEDTRTRTLPADWTPEPAAGLCLAIHLGDATRRRVPAPVADERLARGIYLAERGQLGQFVGISVQRVLIGFVAGASIGLVVGSLVGLSRVASAVLAPTIGAFRAVPSLAWVPLLILYLGINEDSKVTLIAIGAQLPVCTTVAGALRHVDPQLVEVNRAYGLGRLQL
jgi:sulfonate transport system permease protein